jgi:hypothetical protein
VSVSIQGVIIFWGRCPEHFEHSVGDQEAAYDVAGRRYDGDGSQNRGQGAAMLTRQNNRADHGDGVESVGQRH